MLSMSSIECEVLDVGISWWEKELFMGVFDWKKFDGYVYFILFVEE